MFDIAARTWEPLPNTKKISFLQIERLIVHARYIVDMATGAEVLKTSLKVQ